MNKIKDYKLDLQSDYPLAYRKQSNSAQGSKAAMTQGVCRMWKKEEWKQ